MSISPARVSCLARLPFVPQLPVLPNILSYKLTKSEQEEGTPPRVFVLPPLPSFPPDGGPARGECPPFEETMPWAEK